MAVDRPSKHIYNMDGTTTKGFVTHPIYSAMQPMSSRVYPSASSPARKNKSQSQREYRSKEIDGFTELRDALLLVDPFDTPLGRDATRHQLLITGQSIMLPAGRTRQLKIKQQPQKSCGTSLTRTKSSSSYCQQCLPLDRSSRSRASCVGYLPVGIPVS